MGSKMEPMCNSVALWAPAARGTSRGLAPPAPAGLMGRCPHGTQAVAPRSQHKLLAAYLAQEGSAVFGSTGPRGPKGRYFGGEPAPRTTLWLEFPKEKSLSYSTSILFFLSGCFCFGVLGSGWGREKTRTPSLNHVRVAPNLSKLKSEEMAGLPTSRGGRCPKC